MKKLFIALSSLEIFSIVIFGAESSTDWRKETQFITQINERLKKQTIEEFVEMLRQDQWSLPSIPSQGFIETHIKEDEIIIIFQAIRDLGYQLALRMEELAQEQQTLPQNDTLFQRSMLLCDLSEILTCGAGYGNFFLAQRCIDIAAVGLARLTISMEIPIEKCFKLASRMSQDWQEIPYQIRVLNSEAYANIFINEKITKEQLNEIWGIGINMHRKVENSSLQIEWEDLELDIAPLLNAKFIDVEAFTNNLIFFTENNTTINPPTLTRTWNSNQHRRIILRGGVSRTHKLALALLQFRAVVGFFPPPFVRSEEDTKRLEVEIKKYSELGMTITKPEENLSNDPLKEAFRREWEKCVSKLDEKNNYVNAYQAYIELKNNNFFDEEIFEIGMSTHIKQIRQLKEEQ